MSDSTATVRGWLADPNWPLFGPGIGRGPLDPGRMAARTAAQQVLDQFERATPAPETSGLREAAWEAVVWLESGRTDQAEGDAATASRLRAALAGKEARLAESRTPLEYGGALYSHTATGPLDPPNIVYADPKWHRSARHPECTCDFEDEESDLCPFHQRMLGPLTWRTLAFMVIDLSDATRPVPAPETSGLRETAQAYIDAVDADLHRPGTSWDEVRRQETLGALRAALAGEEADHE